MTAPRPEGVEKGRRGEDPRIEQTNRLAFDAVLELLTAGGIQALSVEKVADLSGVARSTIYRRWPDHTQLYVDAIADDIGKWTPPILTGDTATDLERYFVRGARRLNANRYVALLSVLLERSHSDDRYAALHDRTVAIRRLSVEQIFSNGIESGQIRSNVDIDSATTMIVAPFVYIRLFRHSQISPSDRRVLLDSTIAFYATATYQAEIEARRKGNGRTSKGRAGVRREMG